MDTDPYKTIRIRNTAPQKNWMIVGWQSSPPAAGRRQGRDDRTLGNGGLYQRRSEGAERKCQSMFHTDHGHGSLHAGGGGGEVHC